MNSELLSLLTREGVLLAVSVRYWRGCKKLRAEDLGLNAEDVSNRLISLGHKRLPAPAGQHIDLAEHILGVDPLGQRRIDPPPQHGEQPHAVLLEHLAELRQLGDGIGNGPIGRGSVRTSSTPRSSATGLLCRQMTIRSPRAARSRNSDNLAFTSTTLAFSMHIF